MRFLNRFLARARRVCVALFCARRISCDERSAASLSGGTLDKFVDGNDVLRHTFRGGVDHFAI